MQLLQALARTVSLSGKAGAAEPDLEGQLGEAPGRPTGFLAAAKESSICLLLGISPRVVTFDQYMRMRASFFLTHKLSEKFNFLE